MAEYIELVKRVKYAGDVHKELLEAGWDLETATLFVDSIPDADVAPVKHGRWEWYKSPVCLSGDLYYRCSICGESDPWQMTTRCNANYCPNCGAKMDEEE